MSMIGEAAMFAIGAHTARGQVRKYTGEPYWHHAQNVANIVFITGAPPEAVAAAWLHDVVEATEVTSNSIHYHFGSTIAGYVGWLTDTRQEEGNREYRKGCDRRRLAAAPPVVQTIKLADLIDNTSTIVKHDPKFAKVYLQEKAELLRVMNRGDLVLLEKAKELVTQGLREIGA